MAIQTNRYFQVDYYGRAYHQHSEGVWAPMSLVTVTMDDDSQLRFTDTWECDGCGETWTHKVDLSNR